MERRLSGEEGPLVAAMADGPLFTELEGEFAILSPKTGKYYTLDGVGALVWRHLQKKPQTFQALCDAVTQAYDVTPERCETDVKAFLSRLEEAELVTLTRA